MGPAFANLLEIGGDQYEYIQSVIINDFLWHTCGAFINLIPFWKVINHISTDNEIVIHVWIFFN